MTKEIHCRVPVPYTLFLGQGRTAFDNIVKDKFRGTQQKKSGL